MTLSIDNLQNLTANNLHDIKQLKSVDGENFRDILNFAVVAQGERKELAKSLEKLEARTLALETTMGETACAVKKLERNAFGH